MASKDIVGEVERVRQRISMAVAQPLSLSGTEVCVTPTMGVSLYPRDGLDIETLLRNADLAMYCAKERGRNDLAYYEDGMAVVLRQRTSLEADLRHALERDERPREVLDAIEAIEAMGMSIALDDFGTGYSNLAALQRYPIHTVKIDKTFIQGLDTDRPLADMIVSMCRLMRLTVVAEGVETRDQLDWIAGRAIDQYQGFLCARALPAAAFEARFIDEPLAA